MGVKELGAVIMDRKKITARDYTSSEFGAKNWRAGKDKEISSTTRYIYSVLLYNNS